MCVEQAYQRTGTPVHDADGGGIEEEMTRCGERYLHRGAQDSFDRTDMADQHEARSAVPGCGLLYECEDTRLYGL